MKRTWRELKAKNIQAHTSRRHCCVWEGWEEEKEGGEEEEEVYSQDLYEVQTTPVSLQGRQVGARARLEENPTLFSFLQ